jgi:hypothetical protein
VDVASGATVAADDDDAVGTVIPLSSTKDEDEGACVGAFADGAGESAAASVLLPPRRPPSCCAPPQSVALPPPPLMLPPPPPPPPHRQAAVTEDGGAYVGASAGFEVACFGAFAFADGA